MRFVFSPDVILCGWLGSKHQLTNCYTSSWGEPTGLTEHYHHHHDQFLNREGRWGTTDDSATSFLHLYLFSAALWDLPNSRPVHSLMLSSHLFLCLLSTFTVLARWFWPDLMNGKHDHTTAVCVFLRSSGDLHVVQLPAGSWHGLPRW